MRILSLHIFHTAMLLRVGVECELHRKPTRAINGKESHEAC